MPIYVFRCEACGHAFDRLQKLSDPDPDTCPECGAPTVKRQVTAPSFRLAGSGWYETDFKSDKDKRHNLADKGETPATDAKEKAGEKPAKEASGISGPGNAPAKPVAAPESTSSHVAGAE